MTEHQFALGDVVCIDPAGREKGPVGRIIGFVSYADGSIAYVVSAMHFSSDTVTRHLLTRYEIHPIDK